MIDFQDARMGPIQYDLVSLVHDSYVELSEESIQSILNIYLKKAREQTSTALEKQHWDEKHFHQIFELQMIQRCFKACGSFASFYNLRQDTRYLKYINHTLQKVHDCLDRFPEYSDFLKLIQNNNLLDREYKIS